MDPMSLSSLTHVLGCSKCGRPHKGHPLPYGINCILALAEECADESRDIPAWGVEGPVVPTQLGPSALIEPPTSDSTTDRTLHKASGQNDSKEDSVTCHHDNYHHHQSNGRVFFGSIVHQT